MLLNKITKSGAGLKPLPYDGRDIKTLGWFEDYKPKYKEKYLELKFEAKSQYFNTCGWNSSVGAHENIDEGVELDERTFVIFGNKDGKINGDGFSNLRDNEKVLMKFGVAKKGLLKSGFENWEQYSDESLLTNEIIADAYKRRTKSFTSITKVSEVYRAIDEGRTVKIGTDWRTYFNMQGGFSFPWILDFVKGFFVGGHATYIYGYNTEYKFVGIEKFNLLNFLTKIFSNKVGSDYPKKVFKVRNSFGKKYGLNGDFFITEEDLQKQIEKYGSFRNEDLEIDILKWLSNHQGKVVKVEDRSEVYLIQGDKKRKYDDLSTLISHGKDRGDIIIIPDEYLNKVEKGEDIHFWEGGNVKQFKELVKLVQENDPDVLNEMKNYVNNLIK